MLNPGIRVLRASSVVSRLSPDILDISMLAINYAPVSNCRRSSNEREPKYFSTFEWPFPWKHLKPLLPCALPVKLALPLHDDPESRWAAVSLRLRSTYPWVSRTTQDNSPDVVAHQEYDPEYKNIPDPETRAL